MFPGVICKVSLRTDQNAGTMQNEICMGKNLVQLGRLCFLILSLKKNVVQDITQSKNSLELEVLIHDDETVYSRFADSIEDSIQTIIQ
jgi:hypothetical protein